MTDATQGALDQGTTLSGRQANNNLRAGSTPASSTTTKPPEYMHTCVHGVTKVFCKECENPRKKMLADILNNAYAYHATAGGKSIFPPMPLPDPPPPALMWVEESRYISKATWARLRQIRESK